jgi:hypothetical protein
MKYENKNQLIRDLEDEVNMNRAGCVCSPRHVKVMCRRIIQENEWKISRLNRGKSIDNLPTTKYCSVLK